jgi:hypothetical protein
MKSLIPATLFMALLIAAACKKSENYTPDCNTPKTFSGDVSAVIQNTCATNSSCHAAGSNEGPGALTNYQQISNARSGIRRSVADGSMPRNGSLSNAQKDAILCWIDSGAPNN